MYSLRYTAVGWPQAIHALVKIGKMLDTQRDDVALAALQNAAQVFEKNFQTEGRTSGRPWPQLSKSTQTERVRLGFSPDHPILVRYGGLQFATSTFLKSASKTANFYSADPQGKAVGLTITTSGNDMVTALAYGEKAANQVGGGPSNVPERPFWFVTNQVIRSAHDGAVDWLAHEIARII